jgi:hypothetical protein
MPKAWPSEIRSFCCEAVSASRREGCRHQFRLLDLMGEENEPRGRLVVVELRDERSQDLVRRHRLVGLREVGAVAPILKIPEEEHLDAELAGLFVECEYVGVFHRLRVDALDALNG